MTKNKETRKEGITKKENRKQKNIENEENEENKKLNFEKSGEWYLGYFPDNSWCFVGIIFYTVCTCTKWMVVLWWRWGEQANEAEEHGVVGGKRQTQSFHVHKFIAPT